MNKRLLWSPLAAAIVLGGVQGCAGLRPYSCGYPPRTVVGAPCDTCDAAVVPPPRSPRVPTPAVPPPAVPPPVGGIQQGAFIPPGPANPVAPPPDSGVRLSAPEPAEPEPARPLPPGPEPSPNSARLYPPQTAEPPVAPKDERPAPGVRDERGTPPLPVDIPQFAVARPNVASGQQPFPDGVTWLKDHGYRTVLHIRSPGEDDTAARRLFEKAGLRYLSLEVSPQTLTKGIVEEFSRLVTDKNNQPLFVYDRDNSLAGGLWYLHFRIAEGATDEKARADAAYLGFKQDKDPAHLKMWLAIQTFLQNRKP